MSSTEKCKKDPTQVKGGVIIMTGKEVPKETRVPSLCHQTTEIMDFKEFKFHWYHHAESRRKAGTLVPSASSSFIVLMWLKLSAQKQAWEGKGGVDSLFQIKGMSSRKSQVGIQGRKWKEWCL